jgi:DNA-binding transcriptional regulator YiaG
MTKNYKFRVTRVTNNGNRSITMMNPEELQKFRAQRLKELRKNELGMTQKDLANAVGVNLRTLQDWEMGRSPTPRPVEILMNLMKKNPAVKKELLPESAG